MSSSIVAAFCLVMIILGSMNISDKNHILDKYKVFNGRISGFNSTEYECVKCVKNIPNLYLRDICEIYASTTCYNNYINATNSKHTYRLFTQTTKIPSYKLNDKVKWYCTDNTEFCITHNIVGRVKSDLDGLIVSLSFAVLIMICCIFEIIRTCKNIINVNKIDYQTVNTNTSTNDNTVANVNHLNTNTEVDITNIESV